MKPCVRDTTTRSLGYAAYLSHELPRQARKAARWRLFPRPASAARACGCRSARPPARQLDWVNWRPPKKPLPVLMLQLPPDSHCASRSHTPPLATLPDDHEEWLRCRLAEVLAERWWPVRCRWWCLTAPSRAVWGSTDAGAHDGVPKQPPGMSGDMGEYSDGRGRVAHPPCRYHAAHGCALWARTGGSPWGLRTCPINRVNRASRVAKASRNRQARTNIVLFLRRARYRQRSGKYAACSLPHARAGSVPGRSRAAGSQLISRVLGVRLRARASSWSWAAGQLGNRAGQRTPHLPYSFLPHAGLASHDTSTRHKRPLL
jgi:hypothetical protein